MKQLAAKSSVRCLPMDEEDNLDVNVWLGRPPEQPTDTSESVSEADDVDGTQSATTSPSPFISSHESDLVEIPYRPTPPQVDISEEEHEAEDDLDGLSDDVDELHQDGDVSMAEAQEEADNFVVHRQENLTINVPELPGDERDEFDYLPDHFTARRILYALPDRQYIVKLGSGEVDLVSLPGCSNMTHFFHRDLPSCLLG